MPCYSPLTLFKSNSGPSPNGKWPLTSLKYGNADMPVVVPCSRCIGCRLERSRQWAIRCVNEAQTHVRNCFITLTYNDENLVYGGDAYTLEKDALTLFMKRFRKKCGPNIKFFACGEYGDLSGRPHYHACIFGFDFEDKILIKEKDDIKLYTSPLLSKLWPFGFNTVGECNFETAAYVARYILKKKLGKTSSYYKQIGIEPEFTRMSRRPGIGSTWYDQFKSDIYPHDYMVIRGGTKCRPPKYYNGKYELDNPAQYAILKIQREKMALKNASENTKSRLQQKKEVKTAQIKTLLRSLD